MKCLGAKIEANGGFDNPPSLQVLVDETPAFEDLKYQIHQGKNFTLFYAELDGFVNFYSIRGHDFTKRDEGFGRSAFNLTLVDGREITLHGPWSSRSGAMNSVGFGPCMDVSITTDSAVLEKGHTFSAGSVTVGFVKRQVMPYIDTHTLFEMNEDGETVYRPRRFYMACDRCDGTGKDLSWTRKNDFDKCNRCKGTGVDVKRELKKTVIDSDFVRASVELSGPQADIVR